MRAEVSVARNYAVAYLNLFGDDIPLDLFPALQDTLDFWQDHGRSLYFLTMPGVSLEKKLEILDVLLKKIGAPLSLNTLFGLLIQHKRTRLISLVLSQIVALYKQKKDLIFFTVATAHPLEKEELGSIQDFLARQTGKTILYQHRLDKNLIAGIRCQSETLLWEHSVRKQLSDLRRQLILQRAA